MSSSPNHDGSSAKRRKGNDGAVVGFLSSWMGYFTGRRDDSAQLMLARNEKMMERMEERMSKMEEKLESLDDHENEERHEEGEECSEELSGGGEEEEYSSEGGSDSDEESVDSNYNTDDEHERKGRSLHAYQEMVFANRNDWTYSAKDLTGGDFDINSFTEYEVLDIINLVVSIKNCTIKMRRGEYHHEGEASLHMRGDVHSDLQGVLLGPCDYDFIDDFDREPVRYISALRPHWAQFAQALDDFGLILDVMPDDAESCFQISQIQLPVTVFMMIVKSLNGKLFRHYKFRNNDFGAYGIRALIDLMDSNPELRSLTLSSDRIDDDDVVEFLRSMANHPSLTKVNIDCCFEGRSSKYCMLNGLIRVNTLAEISMRNNDLSFVACGHTQSFSDSLASNTALERLDLRGNNLNDEDAASIATALQTNSTLKYLQLEGNDFTEIGGEYFGAALRTNNTLEHLFLENGVSDATFSALFDDSSLNSAADSNHICYIDRRFYDRNEEGDPTGNRQRKIYNVLATRNKTMSNVQHFDDIEINLLPEMLAAVQHYANTPVSELQFRYLANNEVNALSIVYEFMRKWDKSLSQFHREQ